MHEFWSNVPRGTQDRSFLRRARIPARTAAPDPCRSSSGRKGQIAQYLLSPMLGTAAIEVNATRVEVRPTNIRRVPQAGEAYDIVEIETDRGTTTCRYYEAEGARNGVVMVGGTGGGFDTPVGISTRDWRRTSQMTGSAHSGCSTGIRPTSWSRPSIRSSARAILKARVSQPSGWSGTRSGERW